MADSRKKRTKGSDGSCSSDSALLSCPCFREISRGWGDCWDSGDVPRPFLQSNPTPLVALIYGIGRCARESLVLLDVEVRKGFGPFRPCLVGWDDGWWTRPMGVEYD